MNIKNEKAIGDDERDNPAGSDGPGWLEACRLEEAIRKLLGRSDGERLKMGDVDEVTLELGVSRATLYRLITAYRQTPTVEALGSLRQLECYLGWEIAGGYHERIHRALMRSPLGVWCEKAQACTAPAASLPPVLLETLRRARRERRTKGSPSQTQLRPQPVEVLHCLA